MAKKLIMVDCLSQFLIRYVVEVEDDIEHAFHEVYTRDSDVNFGEFSQTHLGQMVISGREINKEEYLKTFDLDNVYLKDWPEEQKLNFINKIDYKE
jgi:hypothetical protein